MPPHFPTPVKARLLGTASYRRRLHSFGEGWMGEDNQGSDYGYVDSMVRRMEDVLVGEGRMTGW